MSDLLRLEASAAPWRPRADAHLISELHRHDIPLVGLIEQHGVTYLFACLVGEAEPNNVWAYALVTEQELARLHRADERDFDAVVGDLLSNRMLQVAVAFDWKLAEWDLVDAGSEGPGGIAGRFLQLLDRKWRVMRDHSPKLPSEELAKC